MTRRILFTWMILLVGACPGSKPDQDPPTARSRQELAEEAVFDGIKLRIAQRPSETELVVDLTLRNDGEGTIAIPAEPGFQESIQRTRTDEFEISVADARHRAIFDGCTRCFPKRSDVKVALKPGEERTFSYRFDKFCYDLSPGEQLTFSANFSTQPSNARDLEPQIPARAQLIVPNGWENAQ